MGSAPPTGRAQTPFTVTAAQQQQLAELQQLLQQDDEDDSAPVEVAPAFGNIPSTRPGVAMGSANEDDAADVPFGAFGATPPSNRSNVPQVIPPAR